MVPLRQLLIPADYAPYPPSVIYYVSLLLVPILTILILRITHLSTGLELPNAEDRCYLKTLATNSYSTANCPSRTKGFCMWKPVD